ncbi:MAG TPA: single-stranded DNA-binding protein [Candidatus Paceibacterota bacterium]|nr:single-stranded DNA-binding protein [Candidatus Paceibacterota bacterium]
MYLNKVQLYGNLTRDPEVKALPSGQNVANFSVATNRVFKDKNGAKQEQTEFHNVVAFGRTADVIGQYLKKGRPVYIEGRIQTRSWEKDGAKQYRTEIVAETFQFGANAGGGQGGGGGYDGGSRSSSPDEGAQSAPADSGDAIQYPDEDINPEDIPF